MRLYTRNLLEMTAVIQSPVSHTFLLTVKGNVDIAFKYVTAFKINFYASFRNEIPYDFVGWCTLPVCALC